MRNDIHPNYHEVNVICACGATFKSKAVTDSKEIKVEICKECHPFYTGKKNIVDAGGRVERFKKKYEQK